MLLAIDTSTSAVTCAVLSPDGAVLAERTAIDPRGTTELLAPLVAEALAAAGATPADVTLVATGTGPGPFTGLRVGVVTALTFAHAREVPVLGVPSHDALAHAWYAQGGAGELLVARRDPGARVDDEEHEVRLGDRTARLLGDLLRERRRVGDVDPARVDEEEALPCPFADELLAVARHAGRLVNHRLAGAGQAVDEGRLAHVRETDDGDRAQQVGRAHGGVA